MSAGNECTVSIVIIAKDEERFIDRCIRSCIEAAEDLLNTQIILVDSLSSDATVSIAQRHDIDIYQLSGEGLLSPAAGRYVGYTHSHGEYVFFVDGDMVVDRNWLGFAVPFLEAHPEVSGIGGMRPNVFEDELNRAIRAGSVAGSGIRAEPVTVLEGGAALFRRSSLDAAGPHNPFLKSGEEAELSFRLQSCGFTVVRVNVPMIYHLGVSKHQGVAVERLRYYRGIGQILREYLHKSNGGHVFRYYRHHLLNALYSAANLGLALSAVAVDEVFILPFALLNLSLLLKSYDNHRNVRSSVVSLIKYNFKGFYIIEGFIRGLKDAELYPVDAKTIQRRSIHG